MAIIAKMAFEDNIETRIIALESHIPTDYSAVIAKMHNDILALQNKIESYDMVFRNITARLDDHGSKLNSVKAGVDAALAQVPKKPTFSIWGFK